MIQILKINRQMRLLMIYNYVINVIMIAINNNILKKKMTQEFVKNALISLIRN